MSSFTWRAFLSVLGPSSDFSLSCVPVLQTRLLDPLVPAPAVVCCIYLFLVFPDLVGGRQGVLSVILSGLSVRKALFLGLKDAAFSVIMPLFPTLAKLCPVSFMGIND